MLQINIFVNLDKDDWLFEQIQKSISQLPAPLNPKTESGGQLLCHKNLFLSETFVLTLSVNWKQ